MTNKRVRFFVKCVLPHVYFIYHRPTHQLIETVEEEHLAKKLKQLIKMTEEEFYRHLRDKGVPLPFDKGGDFTTTPENEKWYEGAWLKSTGLAFKKAGIKLETIPEDTMNQSKYKALQRGWRDAENAPEEAKVLDKPKAKAETKVVPMKPKAKKEYKTKEEAHKALKAKEISGKEYIAIVRGLHH